MIKATENTVKKKYHMILLSIKEVKEDLKTIFNENDYNNLLIITQKTRESTYVKASQRLKKKFEVLSGFKNTEITKNSERVEKVVKTAVLNLTQREIPANQMKLLNLGPKFVPSIKRAPIMEIVTSTEIAALKLEKDANNVDAEGLRQDVSKLLGKYINKKLPSNLDSMDIDALEKLKEDPELKVISFDKGVGVALMVKDEMF